MTISVFLAIVFALINVSMIIGVFIIMTGAEKSPYYKFNVRSRKNKFRNENKFKDETILAAVKYYVKRGYVVSIDSNILFDNPDVIEKIALKAPGKIVISMKVREEVDRIKDQSNKPKKLQMLAREQLKILNHLIESNVVQLAFYSRNKTQNLGMSAQSHDNLIVASLVEWSRANQSQPVLFISGDANARSTAKIYDIEVVDALWTPHKGTTEKVIHKGYIIKLIGIMIISVSGGVWLAFMKHTLFLKHLFTGSRPENSLNDGDTNIKYPISEIFEGYFSGAFVMVVNLFIALFLLWRMGVYAGNLVTLMLRKVRRV